MEGRLKENVEALLPELSGKDVATRSTSGVVLNALATLSAYSEYMFRKPFFPLQVGGLINLAVLLYLSFVLLRHHKADEKEPAL